MNDNKKVAVFGDSISKGIVFDNVTKRYKILKDNSTVVFNKLSGMVVKNYSRFGYTAPKSDKALKASIKKGEVSDYALIELGGNDSDYKWAEISANPNGKHYPKTPLDEFKKTINDMIARLRQNGTTPVMMSLPPIDAERYFKWISTLDGVDSTIVMEWLKEKSMLYRHQELYSLNLERIAIKKNVPFINVRDEFLSKRDFKNYLCVDGIHLNEKGHELLGNVYYTFAKEHGIKSM